MKYGESAFDIIYLLFAVISGMLILKRAKGRAERLSGWAALVLGFGDAFHLVPRVLNYFLDADFTTALGVGKLVTSVTMTLFYVMLYCVWKGKYHQRGDKLNLYVWGLALIRVILCLFPQNGWLQNSSDVAWGIIRNVPFIALGAIVCKLYFQKREERTALRYMWLYILLSFLFYIPVAVLAGIIPMVGMLMLPKTICYVLMIWSFLKDM